MRVRDLLGGDLEPPVPAAPGTVVLAAEDVTLRIGSAEILHRVSASVRAGEVLALVGPNGAGKSSLLAVMSGDRTPTAGAVTLLGRPVAAWTESERAVRRAVMLQQTTVAFSFTVRDVVSMGRAPWARTPAVELDNELVDAALAAADVAQLADRTVTSLSGGELARVAFARVFAQATDVVLLDEPTASLDLRHQEMVMALVRERTRAGAAAVVVLHDLDLASAYADQVAVLAAGQVVAVGPPGEVLTAELVSEVYGHEVDVVPHPRTGTPLVLPRRDR